MTTKVVRVTGVPLMLWWVLVGVACNNSAEADDGRSAATAASPVGAEQGEALQAPGPAVSLGFSVVSDLKRGGGLVEDGAVVCRKGSCGKGIVAYGPYTRDIPQGPRVATFRVSGLAVSSLDQEVAALEVFNAVDGTRLGFRSVKGTDLPDKQEQSLEVAFVSPQESNLEFRIGWAGEGELKMYRVDVR
jgi:hypothetical protein